MEQRAQITANTTDSRAALLRKPRLLWSREIGGAYPRRSSAYRSRTWKSFFLHEIDADSQSRYVEHVVFAPSGWHDFRQTLTPEEPLGCQKRNHGLWVLLTRWELLSSLTVQAVIRTLSGASDSTGHSVVAEHDASRLEAQPLCG